MEPFRQRVYDIVARVPRGSVVTYGQIAIALGDPYGARRVGWAMHACPQGLPWQRVVNSQGGISLGGPGGALQRALLSGEGVVFDERGCIDLAQYQWDIEMENANGTA